MSGIATGAAASLAFAGVTQSKKKKKKCKKKKCEGVCPDGVDNCADGVAFGCGLDCACFTGTARTICGELNSGECVPCEVDADCDEAKGPGSVCVAEVGNCECDGLERACVLPCAEPLPAK